MTHQDETQHTGQTRREFLVKTGIAAAATSVVAAGLPRTVSAQQPSAQRDVLVVLYMRGGMDGVSLCVPYGDTELYNRRPTLANCRMRAVTSETLSLLYAATSSTMSWLKA